MKEVITVGIDIAKNVFQVHGVSAQGDVLVAESVAAARSQNSSNVCHRV